MDNIEEKTAETTTDEVKTVVDGASDVADTSNDAEFTDTVDEENKEQSPTVPKDDANKSQNNDKADKKPQKTNADYARERRKAEQERAIKKARNDAIIEALNGENPYTHEKMEDEADIEEYLTMKEIEKSGNDPIKDYSKFLKTKVKEHEKAQQAESSQKEWIAKDREDFASKHPDINLDELLDDELFRTFALGKAGKYSMDKIYTSFQSFLQKSEERARDRAAQILANNAATPGKLSTQAPPPQKSVSDMSKAEFEQMIEKVKRGEMK